MNSVTYPTTYDQGDGNSPSAIYPRAVAGPVYVTSYDALGRANGMTQNSTALVSNVQYGVAGELQQMTYQLQQYPYTNTTETRQYNSLFQLTNVASYGLSIQYSYAAAGANNGKVASQTDVMSGEVVTYTYDSLNRLISANSTIAGQSQAFGYDGFGNMTAKGSLSVNVDPGTNQLVATGLTYDANGNMTFQPGMTGQYVYDVENRMTSAPGVQYGYDGQNKRNYKAVVNSGGFVTSEEFYFYGADGKKIGTYNLQQVAVGTEYNVTLTFTGTGAGTVAYFRGRVLGPQDRLGSFGKYYSYGDEKGTGNGPNDALKFATYTRDAATGLDYADQRYYSSQFGRFMSADRYMASGGAGDPGSWNRYAYTRGDPVNRFDPQGLADFSVTGFCYGCKDDRSGGIAGMYGGDAMEMDRSGEGTDGGGDGGGGGGQVTGRPPKPSPLESARQALNAVKSAIARAVTPDSLFTASNLDCISGIETGRTWDTAATSRRGRVGLFQFNQNSWKYSGTSIPWNKGELATDAYTSAAVAIGLLYRNLGYAGVANATADAITEAIDKFGEHDGRYGQAVIDCAKKLDSGDFEGAFDVLTTYAQWVQGGRP